MAQGGILTGHKRRQLGTGGGGGVQQVGEAGGKLGGCKFRKGGGSFTGHAGLGVLRPGGCGDACVGERGRVVLGGVRVWGVEAFRVGLA